MSNFNQYRRAVTVPNGNPFTWHGNVEGLGGTGLLEPGELGGVLPWSGVQFQLVKMDSGATSATATGIPAAGQIAFWKDRSNYLVTNDSRFADAALFPANQFPRDHRGSVAGIIDMAVVAGEQFFVQQKGACSAVKVSTSPAAGDSLVPNSGTNADMTTTAAGSAPVGWGAGIVTSATKTGNNVPGYLNIDFID